MHYFDAQPPLLRYGLVILGVVVAVIATLIVPVLGEQAVFWLFFFVIIQSSFWLGLKPAFLAMALSLIAVNAFILFQVWISRPYEAFALNASFSFLSVVIIATTSLHLNLGKALQESRQRYAGIVESAMDAIITIDGDQRVVLFNAAAENMFGYTQDEAIGTAIEHFIPERFRDGHSEQIWAFAQTGNTNRKMGKLSTVTGLRANGEEFPIEASISQCAIAGEKSFTAILRDITEHVHADNALKEQLSLQDQLAKVAASVPGVICSYRLRPDGSSHLPYASPAFESAFGLSLDVVAEDFSPFFACIHPDDIGYVNHTTAESARNLQPWKGRFRYNHPAKGEIWIESHSMPTRETDGSVLWHGYIHDITETKRTEAALRESEEQIRQATDGLLRELRAQKIALETQNEELRQASIAVDTSRTHYLELYDFAPVGYLTLSEDGMIAEINLTGTKLLGALRKELIHQRFAQFIVDEHKGRWQQFCTQIKQQGGRQSIELSICRENSSRLFAHFDCQYKKVNGALPQLRIALTDITERALAEIALRESEARLALVVEEVKAGYWDWNLTTHTLYLSPEWKWQIGFNENELFNRWEEWECRLHPDDRALVLAATENYIAGRQPAFELEFRLRHKDGSYRWIHSRGALLHDSNNHPFRMLGINLDITDYVKTKELSERREKMEQSFSSCVAGQTVAAIAHELNQPLTAIASYADVALHLLQTGNQNPQKLAHVIENCALQAQRAGDVIRQLMTLLHKDETISEPVDINSLVREALAFVKADGHLRTFKIKLNLAAGLPPVAANALQIQKVLVNLLRNGLESMQENGVNAGTMTVTTASSVDHPAMSQVTVSDSGKGVADSVTLKTMFQPFYTTKAAGLGMGLAISRALIEAHGGKIWAEQNTGFGLNVHFTLPFVI